MHTNIMKDTKDLLTRAREMQDRYDELTRVIAGLDEAVSEYKNFKLDLDILKDYLNSGQLKADASQIPAEIKREVLSDDGLYALLLGADKILVMARSILLA